MNSQISVRRARVFGAARRMGVKRFVMAEETKNTGSVIEILKGFGSTRFGVVLAAMGLIYFIVRLTLEDSSAPAIRIAEIGCYLITFLAVCHIASRTFKKTNGTDNGQKTSDSPAELN